MTHALKDSCRQMIVAVLAANPRVERAVLFGSRAMGTNTVTSDVDIALFGEALSLDDQARLAAEIEQLPIPQRVDLVRFHTITQPDLRAHITRDGIEWYRKGEHRPPSPADTRQGTRK